LLELLDDELELDESEQLQLEELSELEELSVAFVVVVLSVS